MRRGIQPGYQIPKSKCEPCLNLNNTRAWWQASGEKLVNQTMPMLCKCKVLNKLYEKEHLRNVYMKKNRSDRQERTHTHTKRHWHNNRIRHRLCRISNSLNRIRNICSTDKKIFTEHSEHDVRILVNILR